MLFARSVSARSASQSPCEIAAEAEQLAVAPSPSPERQHALANYARNVGNTAADQADALEELRRGIESWGA